MELIKHNEKFKMVKFTLDKQTELLRLILNKINIKDNESDDRIFDDDDENGDSLSFDSQCLKLVGNQAKNSPTIMKYIHEYKRKRLKRSEEIYESL